MIRELIDDNAMVGERIRQRRKALGLSQEAVVRMVEEAGEQTMSRATLAKIESGRQVLLLARARPLAKVLGCTVADLLDVDTADPMQARMISALKRVPPDRREELVQLLERMADLAEQAPPPRTPPAAPSRKR